MSVSYKFVLWNRQKKLYDLILFIGTVLFLATFLLVNLNLNPQVTFETQLIRGLGLLAITLLHIILAIGPLSRINRIFMPLLYNRRHLGVTMFFIGAIHGGFSILQFHSQGNVNPIYSLFTSNLRYDSITHFPFQTLGFVALIILAVMAFTSHDFWLKNLSPKVWKTLHMLVYLAYFLLILHVMLGLVQDRGSSGIAVLLAFGAIILVVLHVSSAIKERRIDETANELSNEGWVKVAGVADFQDNKAKIVHAGEARIAIFLHDNKFSAVSNLCRHQNGPIGEGKIIDGCITCPWHGYQYLPENGTSPPPFKEQLETYDLKLDHGFIYVNPSPHPEGTYVEPLTVKA